MRTKSRRKPIFVPNAALAAEPVASCPANCREGGESNGQSGDEAEKADGKLLEARSKQRSLSIQR